MGETQVQRTFTSGAYRQMNHRLKQFCIHLVLGYLLLPSLFGLAFADDQIQALPCPHQKQLSVHLTQKLNQFRKLKSGLEDFLAGRNNPDVPLSALFMIDLNNPDDVVKRLDELNAELTGVQQTEVTSDPLLVCALSVPSLEADSRQISGLSQEVIKLRIQFLSLPAEKRSAILHPQIEAGQQADNLNQLQQEHLTVLEDQKQAAASLAKAEHQVLTAETGVNTALVAKRAELERVRNDMLTLQLRWLADLEKQAVFYQETSEKLAEIARFLLQPESTELLESQYQKSVYIWRSLVDVTRKVVSSRFALTLPALPDYPAKLLAEAGNSDDAIQTATAYREAKEFRQELQRKVGGRLEDSVDLHYRVLLQSGEIRSQLLNVLLDRAYRKPLYPSVDLLNDLKREIAIVPYRWSATFYLRWLEVKRRMHHGWEGLIEIGIDLGLLLGFLLIPFFIWLLSQHLSDQLNFLRIKLVRRSRVYPKAIHLALAIQGFQPYSAWLIMLGAVYLAQQLLQLTLFSELALILPYVKYYIVYRLFRQLMRCDFLWLNKQVSLAKLSALKTQIGGTSKAVGLTVLLVFYLLVAIESLIRRGLVYHYTIVALTYLGLVGTIGVAYQWRTVISAGLQKLLPNFIGEKLALICNGYWGLLLAIPAACLLVVLLVLRLILVWGGHFHFTKRIAAEVFRYQLESVIEKFDTAIHELASTEYRKAFTLSGVERPEQLFKPRVGGLDQIYRVLADWLEHKTDLRSMAIVGQKGIGKTCLLDYLQQSLPADQVICGQVTAKLTTCKQVLEFVSNLLDVPLASDPDILNREETFPGKRVILIDDAHNLFLANLDGFEGIKALLGLISGSSDKIFWCLTFNHHAWSYLNGFNDRHEYFGKVLRISSWSEQDIQDLILTSHHKTAHAVFYDDIIQAAGSQNISTHADYVETRFFNLLWQQSKGNPRLAVYLWLSALRQVGAKALRVGLPEEADTSVFSDLKDDALFVYASIARHENLTLQQLMITTRLPEAAIRHVLEAGVRLKLLDCDTGSIYRLAVLYQYPLLRYLQAKHCLYE